jgi:hypothetical protein
MAAGAIVSCIQKKKEAGALCPAFKRRKRQKKEEHY